MAEPTISLEDIWAEAAKRFQEICGESLQRGDVKNFDDVKNKIENVNKQPYGASDEEDDKWDKAKSVGLQSLKYMKMLLGAASQAAVFIPVPSAAANIAGSALSFVFDVPEKIKGYNDAVDSVFTEVSSALSQFRVYQSIDNMNQPLLIEQIHLVMASMVKICAHVVKYRQGRRRDRLRRQIAAIFDDNKPLDAEMSEFRRLLQAQRDVEGTVTLSVVVKTQSGVAQLLESFAVFAKTADDTNQGVHALKDDNDRTKSLNNIRDTLQIPSTVLLHTRTTQTCTDHASKCLPGTGSWIWTDEAFSSWKEGSTKVEDRQVSNVLVISGPPSSGKTLATAQIIKHLEEEKGRTYVAHYFFLPASRKADEDNKYPVHTCLRYMAFQIARVDATVRKALGKACDSAGASVLTRNTSSNLDSLWSEFKIGGSGSTYYLAFDGIENLDDKDRDMLLRFIFSSKLAEEPAGRVRVLVSGTEKLLDGHCKPSRVCRIDMERYNERDMRLYIEDRLNKQSLLRHAKPGSIQQKARNNVLAKLPPKAAGSYSQLQFALDEVARMLSSRTSFDELDKVLDQAMNSHETAIKALQRSLTVEEIEELNELLKWVHFANDRMTVAELESAMLLYSDKESIGLLEDIIASKYLAILKIDTSADGTFVEGQDGALEYLQKEKAHKVRHSKDQPVISMTINISNVDQEIVGHFLWDLAQKAIRDQFRFNLDSASNTSHARQISIAVDEFEAHHALVMRAFKYLTGEPNEATDLIGRYLFYWLPYHLGVLTQLDYEEKGYLMPDEQLDIGKNLYELFKDAELFNRHKATVERIWWTAEEIEKVHKWLMNSAVVRRVPKQWREEVQGAPSPVRGFMMPFVKAVIENWLRSRDRLSEEASLNYRAWIRGFMEVDDKTQQRPQTPRTPRTNAASPSSPSSTDSEPSMTDWERVSAWCQTFLDLPESELDSLWWERIAQGALNESRDSPEVVMPLFRRALAQENPSWYCHFSLAGCHYQMDHLPEAISEAELTLESTKCEGCRPTPSEADLMMIHFRLGSLYLGTENIQQATEQFLIVSKGSDVYWAEQGRVAYMKAILKANDSEGTKNMLRSAFVTDESEASKVRVLKMIARDYEHNYTISKIFDITKGDPELFKELTAIFKKATDPLASGQDQATDMSRDDRFADQEARGVLLYHWGMTVAYRMSSGDTKSVTNALTFWEDCRDQLRIIGGPVASTTRTNATSQLAKYYFQSLLTEQGPTEHFDGLSKLADEDSSAEGEDPAGYLAILYALRDEKEKAKKRLSRRIKIAMDILSDDQPQNDYLGHRALFKCLAYYQDFDNAAAALTLMGAPDLITNAFQFEDYDFSGEDDVGNEDGAGKDLVIEFLKSTGKMISHLVKMKVPDSSQQTRRIEVAKEEVEGLVDTDSTTSKVNVILKARISALQDSQASVMQEAVYTYGWGCNGLGPPGTTCDKQADFDHEFVHCIYCASSDFCPDCFRKLRQQSTPAMQCSAEHVWIKIPRQGSDFYRGSEAKILRVPVVRPVEGDRNLLEACYDGGQGIQELMLEAWKAKLAKEWDIALEE